MCGIFGVYDSEEAAILTHAGLFALQHRGREGAGIAVHNQGSIRVKKNLGLVQEVFPDEKSLEELVGRTAIGGNRYSTVHKYGPECTQPLEFRLEDGQIATSHNGNITNHGQVRKTLKAKKAIFRTEIDSELFGVLINFAEGNTVQEKIKNSFGQLIGAYSVLIMTDDELIAVRDPWGFRPLEVARINGSYMFASETCAFDILQEREGVKIEEVGSVKPGQIVTINSDGIHYDTLPISDTLASCIFEEVYFTRPDSRIGDTDMDAIRQLYGMILAKEHPVPGADVVISVPDSGNSAATGYAIEAGLPYKLGLVRNHHVGRTFIINSNRDRKQGVARKFNAVRSVVDGNSVVVVDDSLVRGNTARGIVDMLYRAGAREIHLRISSPPIISPCHYGIDFKTREELLVNQLGIEDVNAPGALKHIADSLGVASIAYLSHEGMLGASANSRDSYCTACFTGTYPTQTPEQF